VEHALIATAADVVQTLIPSYDASRCRSGRACPCPDHMTCITKLERGIDAKTADEAKGMRLVLIQYLKY